MAGLPNIEVQALIIAGAIGGSWTNGSFFSNVAMTVQNPTAATGGSNTSSNVFIVQGQFWNGSISGPDGWTFQNVLGSGTNPASTLTFTHSGSSGATAVNFVAASLQLNGISLPEEICSGQIALSTSAIGSGTRATNTLSCSGLNSATDTISCTFSGDTNAVTGYVPSSSGSLSLKVWASANTINVDQVNNTSGSITPGAATVNCKGIR